jgi:hypothetical protein
MSFCAMAEDMAVRWGFLGTDLEEGIDAFFAKRAPVFTAGRSGTREYKRNETEAGALSSQR